MSLLSLLGEMPDGSVGALDWQSVAKWISERYLAPTCEESARVARAQRRASLYRDDGHRYCHELIDKHFEDNETKHRRFKWVEQAAYNNVTRRIVHELATLYRRSARRSVNGDENSVRYQAALRLMRMDERMLDAQRLTILHRGILLRPRVPQWSGLPRLDIIERHQFRVVRHPLEPERLIAVIIEQSIDSPNSLPSVDSPKWVVWTDFEWFRISGRGDIVGEPQENRYGRIPYILCSLNPPPGELIDPTTFEDVISAHLAVWFEAVLLLKESQSATKIPTLSGDTTRAARGQVIDSNSVLELPEGVALSQSDTSMDLSMFRDTADHILERAAANHGIPPAILHHAGATSGYEIELRHVGIRERRIEQEGTFRETERELAELTSVVLASDAPQLSFTTDGWSLNYGETQMPRAPREQLETFEHARRLGLVDTIEELIQRDSDLSEEDAWVLLKSRIENETERNRLMRPMQAQSGALSAVLTEPEPEELNGTITGQQLI